MEPLYIGMTSAKAGDPVLPPVPPSYRGKPKGAEWLEDKRQLLESVAPMTPLLGRITSVVVLDAAGTVLYEDAAAVSTGPRFIDWLVERLDDQLRDTPVGDDTPCHYLLCGVNVQELIAVAAFEALQIGATVPVKLWRSPRYMYDPFDMLAAMTQRLVTLDTAFELLRLPAPEPEPWSAMRSALYARQLARALQVFGTAVPANCN